MAVHGADCLVVLGLEARVGSLQALLELLYNHEIVQIFRRELGLRLLLRGHLLLLQLLYFELELVEVQRAFFFCSVELLPMKGLKATVLFDPLLQVSLVLGRDVLDLLVEPLNLQLAHNVLLPELLKGRATARLLLLLVTHAASRSGHDVDCSNVLLRVAEALRVRAEYLNRALSEVADLALQRV